MPQGRRLLLYVGLAVTAVLFAGDAGMRKFVDQPLEMAQRRESVLQKDIQTQQEELRQATKSLKRLDQLREYSLPSNPELARSRYQAWLLDLIEQVGLKGPNVDSGEAQNYKGLYQVFTFTVRGRGTLAQVTQFLYLFYEAGHLHKIRSLTMNPLQDQIDLAVTLEALALKGSSRQGKPRLDQLTSLNSDSLAFTSLGDYQSLVNRNVFRAGNTDQAARTTILTAIISDASGQREVWFRTGKDSRSQVLRENDTLNVGTLSIRIVEILVDQVLIQLNGQPRTLSVGKSLAEGVAVSNGA